MWQIQKNKLKLSKKKISGKHNTDTASRYRLRGAQQRKAQSGLCTHRWEEVGDAQAVCACAVGVHLCRHAAGKMEEQDTMLAGKGGERRTQVVKGLTS